MAEDLRLFLQAAGGTVSPCSPCAAPMHPARLDLEATPASGHIHGNPTPTSSRSRSSPRGCDRLMSMTPTSSWNCCPVLGTGTDCPRACGSGRLGSSRPTPTRRFQVGLIYGPSGCGKSSLVKAGLLPRLGEARAAGLHRGDAGGDGNPAAARACARPVPTCRADLGLVDSLAAVAKGPRSCRSEQEGADGPGPVRAMAPCPAEVRRTPNWSPLCGSAMASTSRRS